MSKQDTTQQKPPIFGVAHSMAVILQKMYPVNTNHINDGKEYGQTGLERIFKRSTLKHIRRFSRSFMDNEFRSMAFNHLQFMEITDFLFAALASRAQKKSPLPPEDFKRFNAALRSIFEDNAVTFDLIPMSGELKKNTYLPTEELDKMFVKDMAGFAAFAQALHEEALEFRQGYYNAEDGPNLTEYAVNLSRRNQPEHVLAHAIPFATGICLGIAGRYLAMRKQFEIYP